jgi:transcriptional/translational regulatory protein YebC/TACO1
VSDLKHLLTAAGGSLGGAGSVGWMFGQWGVIVLPADQKNLDELELNLIDAGVEDITEDPDEGILIKTKLENFQKVLHKLKALGIEPLESGIRWIAKEKVSAGGELEGKLAQLFSDLEAHDDVEDYFTNAQ